MAAEKTTDYNAQPIGDAEDRLRGGTQGGEAARLIDPHNKEGGTPAIASASGGVHPEAASQAVPRTDVGQSQPSQES